MNTEQQTATPQWRLPAEWEPQSFIQLTWPHAETDWAPYLQDAIVCYVRIVREIVKHEDLLIVSPEPEAVADILHGAGVMPTDDPDSLQEAGIAAGLDDGICRFGEIICANVGTHKILVCPCATNDTWARDHAFITTTAPDGGARLNDFCFNGWGMKFAADKDNQINHAVYEIGAMPTAQYCDRRNTVLEGGAVESDGRGTVLTTTSCLLSINRNNFATKEEAEQMLRTTLEARRILWLDHGYLAGDDTDSHIDTLARLCPDDTIVYVKCDIPNDEHYAELHLMEQELMAMRTAEGHAYRLMPLPMPKALYDDGMNLFTADDTASSTYGSSILANHTTAQRLPATYANFLVMNDAVLMPTYGQPQNDATALQTLQEAFPGRDVIGIDCRVLVRQHGSLHCITMQYPKEVKLNTLY